MNILFIFNSKCNRIVNDPETIKVIKEKLHSGFNDINILEEYDLKKTGLTAIKKGINLTDFDRILIAGGDGTISTVVNEVIDFKIPVGVIPLGTFNNFAKSLGISRDFRIAVDGFISGEIKKIDVGNINGRKILNNSSVGIYPKLVLMREESQANLGLSKFPALLISFMKSVFMFPLFKVSLSSEDTKKRTKTTFALISNNKYELNPLEIGKRKSMEEGLLYIYLIRCKTRLCVMKVLLKILFHKVNEEKDFELLSAKRVELNINKHEVEFACDGEVFRTKPPLKYNICPKCLHIIMPEKK